MRAKRGSGKRSKALGALGPALLALSVLGMPHVARAEETTTVGEGSPVSTAPTHLVTIHNRTEATLAIYPGRGDVDPVSCSERVCTIALPEGKSWLLMRPTATERQSATVALTVYADRKLELYPPQPRRARRGRIAGYTGAAIAYPGAILLWVAATSVFFRAGTGAGLPWDVTRDTAIVGGSMAGVGLVILVPGFLCFHHFRSPRLVPLPGDHRTDWRARRDGPELDAVWSAGVPGLSVAF